MSARRVGLAALALLSACAVWWTGAAPTPWRMPVSSAQAQSPAKGAAPVPVRVARVLRQDLPQTLQAVGQVQSLHQVAVRPQTDGVLTELHFKEGQRVQRGQVLARLDDRSQRAQLRQSEAELQRLRSQLSMARLDLQRYEGLLTESAVSAQQRDQQLALVNQLQAQIQAQEAAVAAAQVQLSYTTITSPVSGRAGLRQVDVGNLLRVSDALPLVTVTQTQPMAVVFTVHQSRLGEVREALRVAPDGASTVQLADHERGPILAQGRLTTVDNRVDPATGTLKLKAEVPNAQERLWSGQFVHVTWRTGQLPQALVVPTSALQRGIKGTMVWRVREGKADVVPVQVRWQNDALAALALASDQQGALIAGDAVVTDGHTRLKPRAAVRVSAP